MVSWRLIGVLLVFSMIAMQGCGSGGGLGLSGGSVPVGGRVVSGVALLPDGSAVVNSTVTVSTVPSGITVQTGATDGHGKFTINAVPTNTDISIVVMQPPSTKLELIVAHAALSSSPDSPLDVGSITALTTIVAASIHLEHESAPEDSDSIIANQQADLTAEVYDMGYSQDAQMQFIGDPNRLNSEALTLIVPVTNLELVAYSSRPSVDTASTALNGVLGYVRAAHKRNIHLDSSTRTRLIDAQLAGSVYSPDVMAAALRTAHVNSATALQVSSASQREHTELTALPNTTAGISPLEALVIAADIDTHGGFQLDQNGLNIFLRTLIN